jgi:multidrug efflux pump subunit AcrA (membrane-fusion protein)
VPQDEAFGVAPGVNAVSRVPEIPDREFPGKVTRIADALQPGSRTLLTEIDVPNPDYVLSPGVYCTVELKIPRKTPSLVVPAEAIVFNRDGLNVAVVENGVAHIRHVTLVRDLGNAVEVSDGVKDRSGDPQSPGRSDRGSQSPDQQRPSAGGRRRRPRWLAMTISRVASLINSSLAEPVRHPFCRALAKPASK